MRSCAGNLGPTSCLYHSASRATMSLSDDSIALHGAPLAKGKSYGAVCYACLSNDMITETARGRSPWHIIA
jgi:hypothetical protein